MIEVLSPRACRDGVWVHHSAVAVAQDLTRGPVGFVQTDNGPLKGRSTS